MSGILCVLFCTKICHIIIIQQKKFILAHLTNTITSYKHYSTSSRISKTWQILITSPSESIVQLLGVVANNEGCLSNTAVQHFEHLVVRCGLYVDAIDGANLTMFSVYTYLVKSNR